MRTTVTLDPDVQALLETAMREQGISFEEALNAAVRTGLSPNAQPRSKFVQRTVSLGSEQYFRWDKALGTDAAIEDEELSRKLSPRK